MALYAPNGSFRITPTEDLLTDGGTGPNRRIRVDVGQTGFFAGREFRTYLEFNANIVIRGTVPINTILNGLTLNVIEGEVRLETVVGGTPGGTFSSALPILPRNTMSEVPAPYTPQVVLESGGTHTGGTVIDVVIVKSAGNSNFASSVGADISDERGIGAGTYYFRLTVTGTTRGILKARWEERP